MTFNAFFGRRDVFPIRDVEDHFARQARQAGVSERREQHAVAYNEQIRIVRLGNEAVYVEHDGAVDTRDVRLDCGEDVVEKVVVVDLRVEALRRVTPDRRRETASRGRARPTGLPRRDRAARPSRAPAYLGESVGAIASEKAGIRKSRAKSGLAA